MLRTTPGSILIDASLPEDLRDPTRVLDSKGIRSLFQALADKHPEKYKDVSHRLLKLGGEMAYAHGGLSFGLEHLKPAKAALAIRARIQHELDQILDHPGLDDPAREKAIVDLGEKYRQPMEDEVFRESLAEGNPLALQVLSGVRGNKSNIKSLRGGDLLYTDHKGNTIPMPVLRSYSEGLTPAEYWAGAYGARRGVTDVKLGVAQSGYLAKTLLHAGHRLVVTGKDHPEPGPDAEDRGLPVSAGDPDNEGALLARSAGGFARDTVLTPRVLKALRDGGVDKLLVRSPLVGGPADGGVYARDVGVREKGRMAPIGDYVGIAAANALGEKATQLTLSSKHSGGVAGSKSPQGLKAVEKLINPPKVYAEAATHAQADGRVNSIVAAPQGGQYVDVAGIRHYVSPDHELSVKAGDDVEAGDAISDGVPNPSEIVKHKGIGEGRRYLTSALHGLYRGSGLSVHRRNVELVARGLLNHVEVDDEIPGSDLLPGDVAPYQAIEADYEPRPGHSVVSPSAAVGQYLEAPVLHHTIGTKIRPSTAKELGEWGIKKVTVHNDPPPFSPVMVNAKANLGVDVDPFVRHLGFSLQKSTMEAVHRSRTSDTRGTSFVSAMMAPETFGTGPTGGYDPDAGEDDDD